MERKHMTSAHKNLPMICTLRRVSYGVFLSTKQAQQVEAKSLIMINVNVLSFLRETQYLWYLYNDFWSQH